MLQERKDLEKLLLVLELELLERLRLEQRKKVLVSLVRMLELVRLRVTKICMKALDKPQELG